MKYQVTKKIEGGKLITLKIETDNGTIKDIKIYGDFFLHPEESITHIENNLKGLSADSSLQTFTHEIETALAQKRAAFLGITPQQIAETISQTVS